MVCTRQWNSGRTTPFCLKSHIHDELTPTAVVAGSRGGRNGKNEFLDVGGGRKGNRDPILRTRIHLNDRGNRVCREKETTNLIPSILCRNQYTGCNAVAPINIIRTFRSVPTSDRGSSVLYITLLLRTNERPGDPYIYNVRRKDR